MIKSLRSLSAKAFILLIIPLILLEIYIYISDGGMGEQNRQVMGVGPLTIWTFDYQIELILKLALTTINTFLIIYIGNNTRLTSPPSVLSGFFYVFSMLLFRTTGFYVWILIFQLFILIYILILESNLEKSFSDMNYFHCGLLIGLMSMLTPSAVLLILHFILYVNLYKSTNLRMIILFFLGLFLPFIYWWSYLILTSDFDKIGSYLQLEWHHIFIDSYTIIFLLVELITVILVLMQNAESRLKLTYFAKQKRTVLILLMCFTLLIGYLSPSFDLSYWQMGIPALSLLLGSYYSFDFKKVLSLSFFIIFVLLSFIIDYLKF